MNFMRSLFCPCSTTSRCLRCSLLYITSSEYLRMKALKHLALLLACIILPGVLTSQTSVKLEREVRIDAAEVPASAREFISSCDFSGKVKWYQEFGKSATTYEAKTTHRNTKYSIEFDADGQIEDIEYEVEFETLPAKVRERMHLALCKYYDHYSIVKTQVQWTGPTAILLANVQNPSVRTEPTIRFEIVLKGKSEKVRRLYEVLFEENGDLISRYELVPRNTDHLDY